MFVFVVFICFLWWLLGFKVFNFYLLEDCVCDFMMMVGLECFINMISVLSMGFCLFVESMSFIMLGFFCFFGFGVKKSKNFKKSFGFSNFFFNYSSDDDDDLLFMVLGWMFLNGLSEVVCIFI